jgi:hypothetical protein
MLIHVRLGSIFASMGMHAKCGLHTPLLSPMEHRHLTLLCSGLQGVHLITAQLLVEANIQAMHCITRSHRLASTPFGW